MQSKIKFKIRSSVFALLLLAVFGFSGCTVPFKADIPQGFAVSKKGKSFLVYSPDGFKLKIKTEKNNPQKDTLFWAETLKTHLAKNGYFLFDEASSISANLEWRRITWLMPVNHDYYKYMTAIAVKGKRIYIIEASGEKKLFDNYEEDIEKIISSVSAK